MIRSVLPIAVAAVSLSACAGLKSGANPSPVAVAATTVPQATPAETQAAKPTPAPVVPAPRTCVPRTLPPPPRYPDSDAALRDAAGAADRYQLMAAGRLLRQKRLDELERIVAGCR